MIKFALYFAFGLLATDTALTTLGDAVDERRLKTHLRFWTPLNNRP
jgi:hypothetical protein